jgi:chemotaxis response regulator CheB
MDLCFSPVELAVESFKKTQVPSKLKSTINISLELKRPSLILIGSSLELKSCGAYAIGQNEESCMVYGMPKAAFELAATRLMASTEEIVELLGPALAKLKVA